MQQAAGWPQPTRGAPEALPLGSGTAAKTRVLLDAMYAAGTLQRYVPVDVTEQMVRDCAEELTREYPGLRVHGVIGDFERHLDRVPPAAGPRIVAFLGGTIGNFPPGSRRRVLRQIGRLLPVQLAAVHLLHIGDHRARHELEAADIEAAAADHRDRRIAVRAALADRELTQQLVLALVDQTHARVDGRRRVGLWSGSWVSRATGDGEQRDQEG